MNAEGTCGKETKRAFNRSAPRLILTSFFSYFIIRTECDSDAGTYLSTAYNQTLPSSKNGLSTIAPKDSCLHRIPNLSYRPDGFNPIMGVCNGSNPRVLQQLHVDPAECMCRTCPSNWTSDGGIPSRTACRPLVIPQYFLLEIEVTTSNLSPYRFNNSKQNDRTTLHSGRQIIEEIKERLLGKARHLDIQLYGPVVRRNIGGNTSIFSSIHSFKSYWKDQQREVNLLDSLKEHCFDLSSAAACQQCQAAIGVDICNAVKAAVGGSGITFSRLDLEYLDVPPGNLKPLRVSTCVEMASELKTEADSADGYPHVLIFSSLSLGLSSCTTTIRTHYNTIRFLILRQQIQNEGSMIDTMKLLQIIMVILSLPLTVFWEEEHMEQQI